MSTGVIGKIGHLVTQHAEKGFEPENDFASTRTRPRENIAKGIQRRIKPVRVLHLASEVNQCADYS